MRFQDQVKMVKLKWDSVKPRGVQHFRICGPHWKKSCLVPHIKYTNTNKTDEQKKGLK